MARSLTINEGVEQLALPDGKVYSRAVGEDPVVVTLTDEQWAELSESVKTSGLFTDNGDVATGIPKTFVAQSATILASHSGTTDETSLLSVTSDIPANTLTPWTIVRISASGRIVNNTGALATVTLRVNLEDVEFLAFSFIDIPADVDGRVWKLDAFCIVYELVGNGLNGSGLTILTEPGGAGIWVQHGDDGSLPADLATELNFDLTAEHSVISGDLDTFCNAMMIEAIAAT